MTDFSDRNRPRTVVFYGRVSTEREAQLSALENQMQWYNDEADRHKNWTVVDMTLTKNPTPLKKISAILPRKYEKQHSKLLRVL